MDKHENRVDCCRRASGCSARRSRLFNEEVREGRHAKPADHWDAATARWRLFEETDGHVLRKLHRCAIHGLPAHDGGGDSRLSVIRLLSGGASPSAP
jgi:hypothetical protein